MLRENFTYDNVSTSFDRGYTLYEHYDEFGLINMNGRVYDPYLSTFLSPDNYIQCPDNSQNFNRYAYCMYNPLKYVDPSGERIVGWDPLYLAIMEASEVVLKQWFSDYSVAMASNELTQRLSSNLYSHGPEPPVSRLAQDFGYNLGVQNSFSLTIKHIIHLFWP